MEIKILHVGREGEPGGVSQQNGGVRTASLHIIDHCVIEHSGIAVLVLDIDAVTGNLVVERSFRNLQLGRFLPRGEEERPHLDLRPWKHIVLKEKSTGGHYRYKNDKRTHHLQKRHSGGLDRRKLRLLAQIAESHQTRQQNGKRKSHRHHGHRGIEEQLRKHRHRQAFPHKIIDVKP